ncbi:MAG: hypothetical protein ACOC2Y_08170 [Spirochaetota bacterium]
MRLRLGSYEVEPLHLVGAVVVLSLIAVVIVVAVMSPRRSADTQDETPPPMRSEWVTVDRLVIPRDFARADELDWVPYRPRREVWTDEQIAEYWLDPREIGLDVLDAEVEEHIRELLREVP